MLPPPLPLALPTQATREAVFSVPSLPAREPEPSAAARASRSVGRAFAVVKMVYALMQSLHLCCQAKARSLLRLEEASLAVQERAPEASELDSAAEWEEIPTTLSTRTWPVPCPRTALPTHRLIPRTVSAS